RLGLDVIDLYLIHWPLDDTYVEAWRGLEKLYHDGAVRAIGVSNFDVEHLERLRAETQTVPAVNQIELHPYRTRERLHAYNAEQGIITEAWAPIAKGAVLDEPEITELASKYHKSAAQVVLRWQLQSGNVAIPKSVTPSRITE